MADVASPRTSAASEDRTTDIEDQDPQEAIADAKQTIINLKAKVAELESQVKKLNEKHAREAEIATESITNKNSLIDIMRIKLNRYEFAVKEGILFLGKPMLSYEEWLNRGGGTIEQQQPVPATGASESSRFDTLPTVNKTYAITEVKSLSPGQMAEKQQAQKASDFDNFPIVARGNGAGGAGAVGGPPNFEVQLMECMRLALNYLKNAHASVQAITSGVMPATSQPKLNFDGLEADALNAPPPQRSRNPSQSRDSSPGRKPLLSGEKNSGTQTPPLQNSVASSSKSIRSFTTSGTHERTLLAQRAASALFNAATSLPEDDESDLATNQRSSGPSTPTTGGRCANCRELTTQLHQHQLAIDSLKSDITELADELDEERAVRDRLQLSKDILDQELEELTAQLFDQANRMVIDEAKMRDQLEQSNRQLRGELGEVAQKFHRRDEELRALRAALRALEAAKLRSTSHSNLPSSGISPTSPLGSYSNLGVRRRSSLRKGGNIGSPYGSNPTLAFNQYAAPTLTVDGIIYAEFQDHVRDSMSAVTTMPNTTNFVKRCMAEDIEPCLFYVYHQDSGGLFKGTGGLSASGRKRLLDNVARAQCEITPQWRSRESLAADGADSGMGRAASRSSGAPSSGVPSSPSSQSSSPSRVPTGKAKCLTCTLTRDCEYKIRFPPTLKPSTGSSNNLSMSPTAAFTGPELAWHPLCRFCRDRVLAVLEFYAFLAHIRDGVKQGATLLGMFRQALWLRRRMAICRIGSTALFEGDVGAAGYTGGGTGRFEAGGEWENWVHILP
ncbi:rab guanine nucleotide exchange factor S2 [Geranomyces variabilis]|uniref:Rab guanine nucleotide exchange factor S2 n=1 Tax=Geranomyces variabilis TaxID=109894 RepID=A0AAD5XSK5_9FUNG|nr:rab guanine nucleotide exchange factor S2 [Geranomyces variabilis]